MSCPICCDSFTQMTRSEISCPRQECLFTCCKNCLKTYFTTSANNPHCMNCKFEFEDTFIIQQINHTFFKTDLRKKQSDILLQIEQSRIPQTQEQAKQVLYIENRNKIIREIEQTKKKIRNEYELQLRELKDNYLVSITNLNERIPPIVSKEKTEKTFTIRCQYEDCKGFLSSSYKCGICDKYTCSKCFDGLGIYNKTLFEAHTCEKDKVETVLLIRKETRACPACSTRISKIEGCDQMWCTQCHTAFSWRTGFIETNIHNPHFYEWQRRMNNGVAPRVAGDVPCGGNREITHMTPGNVSNAIKQKLNYTVALASPAEAQRFLLLSRRIYRICESVSHLTHVQMDAYQAGNRMENNLELRVEYLQKKISEEEFKIKVQRANKMHEKKREISGVLNLFVTTVADIIHRVEEYVQGLDRDQMLGTASKIKAEEQIGLILDEVEAIRTYSNECLLTIAGTYGSKPKKLVMYDILVHRLTGERNILV